MCLTIPSRIVFDPIEKVYLCLELGNNMSKKHRIPKCLHISQRNCAILEYLDTSNSEIVNQALEFYRVENRMAR